MFQWLKYIIASHTQVFLQNQSIHANNSYKVWAEFTDVKQCINFSCITIMYYTAD